MSYMFEKNHKMFWISAISCVLTCVAVIALPSSNLVRLFLLLFVILFHGYLLGQRLTSSHSTMLSASLGLVAFLAIQSLVQTLCYYANIRLGSISDAIALVASVVVTHIIVWITDRGGEPSQTEDAQKEITPSHSLLAYLILVFHIAITLDVLRHAWLAATTASIRTPWPLLPHRTLWLIALGWGCLLLSTWIKGPRWTIWIHAMLSLATTTFLTPLIYTLGFGFDGFLHIASEKILLTTGTLSPKPLYYIGQYVFTTWLARLSFIPIDLIDRWLVPVSSAVLLPLAWLLSSTTRKQMGALFFLLPLGLFIATTPQSLAYVLGCSALLLTIGVIQKKVHPLAPLILAAWSIAVHPLAGLPLLLVILGLLLWHQSNQLIKILSVGCLFLSGAIIPISFYLHGPAADSSASWNLHSLFQSGIWIERLSSFVPWIGNHFALWPAWASLIAVAMPVMLIVFGLILPKGEMTSPLRRTPYLLAALILFASSTILKTAGDFSFLIDYERGNYADRLNLLALLVLLPVAGVGLSYLLERVRSSTKLIQVSLGLFLIAIATASTYNALPRHDALIAGHGWSTSANDIEAVKQIDRDARQQPYVVLANQSVSAGAVSILGFKRYAYDNVFFYPIPTGGRLYQLFLKMTYDEPSLQTVREAGQIGEADLVYVVLNNYWWKAEPLSESLHGMADDSWEIDGGAVRIYKFDLKKDSNRSKTVSTR